MDGKDTGPSGDSSSEGFGLSLLEQHVEYLTARGVTPDVASERGYRSADTKTQLKSIGFGESQRMVPGLVIPTHDVVSSNGECSGYQYRPDVPRAPDGRVVKFETPRNAKLSLDVPPRVRQHLANPDVPLWITEGAVKADAAASAGLACVALFGVYGWRAKSDFGGTQVIPQLEWLHLKDRRRVYLAFDSDVMLKLQVHDALSRLYGVLEHRGADVAVVLLPAGEHAEKTGLDDYFVRGGTVDELLARHVTVGVPQPPTLVTDKDKGPEPIVDDTTLAGLLDVTRRHFCRFLIFDSDHQADALALWVAHAWLLEAFDLSPRLLVTAPTKRAAKSRVLDVGKPLVPRGRRCGSASGASVFRLIDQLHPTLLLDEADRIFKNRAGDAAADLMAQVIDQGFERGTPVIRVEKNSDGQQEVKEYEAFAATAIAGIDKGGWPDTVVDRSVIIRMRRRRKDEKVEKFRRRGQAFTDGETIGRRWAGFVQSNPDLLASLSGSYPGLPDVLHDRAMDCWEPLVAIADAAGGDWPKRARRAAVALTPSEDDGDELGVALLADIFRVWSNVPLKGQDEVTTKELVDALLELGDESPWPTHGKQGKGLTGRSLAWLLRPFGINPGNVGPREHRVRGYARSQFETAWGAYESAATSISGVSSAHRAHSLVDKGETATAEVHTEGDGCALGNDPEPLRDKGVGGVGTSALENDTSSTPTTPSSEADDGPDYEVF
jgi:Protein of unknown function (DUF3631)/Domain of unknown function (DUF3854)